MVSGEDLVEHMLYIASGQEIPARLTSAPHLTAKGSAIESRVYAEDPLRCVSVPCMYCCMYSCPSQLLLSLLYFTVIPTEPNPLSLSACLSAAPTEASCPQSAP